MHEVPVVNDRNLILTFDPISLVEYVCILFLAGYSGKNGE